MPLDSRAPLRPIPVHLITGFLGTGKSSFIQALVAAKPADEHWAILVNEFGQVGIDQALFVERDDITVKGLPGGCMCCQLAFVLQAGLVSLIHQARPDRLIIEPSGLGHPAGLIDVLRGEGLASALVLQEVITLLDPRALEDARTFEHGTFQDQLSLAGGVVLSKRDLSTPQQLTAAHDYLEGLWPRKRWIAELGRDAEGAPQAMREGDDATLIEWLINGIETEADIQAFAGLAMPAEHRVAHASARLASTLPQDGDAVDASRSSPPSDASSSVIPLPGAPVIEQAERLGHASIGWRLAPAEVFDLDRLTQWLDGLPREWRVKGVFHVQEGWRSYNRANGRAELSPSSWRQDSRLELIASHSDGQSPMDSSVASPFGETAMLTQALLACRSDGAAEPFSFFR